MVLQNINEKIHFVLKQNNFEDQGSQGNTRLYHTIYVMGITSMIIPRRIR